MVQAKKLGLVSNEQVVMATCTLIPTQHKLRTTNQNYNIFYKLKVTLEHLCIDTEIKKRNKYLIFVTHLSKYY